MSKDSAESSTNRQHRQQRRTQLEEAKPFFIPSRKGPWGTLNRVKGQSPAQFLPGHQQGKKPREKRPRKDKSFPESPVPVLEEEQQQSTKD
ncbi:hypothetical protein TNCV_5044391 [Trichonephila clavipes]|uniref:Uncharacterized protein n=1 Tax=Trichonephila clavipes TaxID=2585209 RepID=A0A8X6WHI6_TRICX|nr:hypothetical protein TNCV_5044391 [Trichonephila clavipes]